MSKKTTLAALLTVMLVATAWIVWDVAADDSGVDPYVCAYASESPCPTNNDCGYRWDGICCIPRCQGALCLGFCQAEESLNSSLTP